MSAAAMLQAMPSNRRGQEDQQQAATIGPEHLDLELPAVHLKLDAEAAHKVVKASEATNGGPVHVAVESWIIRASAKARAKSRH